MAVTVPANKILLVRTVHASKELLAMTVPANNLFLILLLSNFSKKPME
jgi:hypothetical protein